MKLDRSRFWERKEELIVGSVIVLHVDLLNSQWDGIFDSAPDIVREEVEVNVKRWFDNGRRKRLQEKKALSFVKPVEYLSI